jgi:hypothetical protein
MSSLHNYVCTFALNPVFSCEAGLTGCNETPPEICIYQGLAVHPVKRKLGFNVMKIKKTIATVLFDTLASTLPHDQIQRLQCHTRFCTDSLPTDHPPSTVRVGILVGIVSKEGAEETYGKSESGSE